MKKDKRSLHFVVDPIRINGRYYQVFFPDSSRYNGCYMLINLDDCSVDNTEMNRLIYTDDFFSAMPIYGKDDIQEITLAEAITELNQ